MVSFDFSEQSDLNAWFVVNDGVMGGSSQSNFTLNADGIGLFQGKVSLENNGGFTSVHCRFNPADVSNSGTLIICLKGDGKKCQVRIQENSDDCLSYITTFQTSGKWETIELPLNEMFPSFRGRKLDLPNYSGNNTIVELTFLVGNEKAESFTLELQKAYLK